MKHHTKAARRLRKLPTEAEQRLWSRLRGEQSGVAFRRQHPVKGYIVDFYAPIVKLAMDEDKLTLSVNSPDAGSAAEELVVAYPDEPMEIGFNAKYLLEIASQVDRENAVFLFNNPGDPTLVREGDDASAVYVVMPMRV